MNSDAAVKVKGQDLLNRYGFATEIVKGILTSFHNGQESIVIGINGEWGCGKSSLMEFIKSEILVKTQNEPYRNYIFEFNPWRIRGNDELLKEFLIELGKILGNYSESYEHLKSDFNRLVDTADKINALNPDPASKFAFKGFKTFKDLVNRPLSLEKLKSEALERLEDNNIKLFIFIDDLDRCTPEEITQLFQVVKLNMNYKNTIFFISYDKEIVVSALNKEYGRNGEKYLEKIVQVDYLVPKILPEQLKLLFRDNLNAFSERFKLNIQLSDIDSIWESGLNKYFSSLRHIYRLINALELRISHIIEDVYPFDFLILESMRIFDYLGYEWIYKHREDLIYREIVLMPTMVESVRVNSSQKEFIQNHPNLMDVSAETKSLIIALFEVNDNNSTPTMFSERSKVSSSEIDLKRRIASQKYFDHYFSFAVSQQNLPIKEIKSFIQVDTEQKKEALTYYFNNQKFERFLDQLCDVLTTDSFEHKLEVVKILLFQSDIQQYEIINIGDFRLNALKLIVHTITRIGKSLNSADEKSYFLKLLLIKENGSYSRLYLLDQLYMRFSTGRVHPETEFFDDSLIRNFQDKINKKFKDQIRYFAKETIKNPFKYDIELVKYFLTMFHELFPREYKGAIEKLIKIPDNVFLLLRCSFTQVTRSGYDKPGFNLTENHQLPEFSTIKFEKLISKIHLSDLNDENKKYYNIFIKLKENKFNKDQFFTLDLENWR